MKFWISCHKFTVQVNTDARDVIIDAAPIVQRFKGQHVVSLLRWAKGLGGLKWERM
jgi:hypothetical protein